MQATLAGSSPSAAPVFAHPGFISHIQVARRLLAKIKLRPCVRACKTGAPQSCWPAESNNGAYSWALRQCFWIILPFSSTTSTPSCCFKFAPLQLHESITKHPHSARWLFFHPSCEIKFTVTRVIKFKFACRSARVRLFSRADEWARRSNLEVAESIFKMSSAIGKFHYFLYMRESVWCAEMTGMRNKLWLWCSTALPALIYRLD